MPQLDQDVARFHARLELSSVVDLAVLQKGARLAQNPRNPAAAGLSPTEVELIKREEAQGFNDQTKFLKVCFVAQCAPAFIRAEN